MVINLDANALIVEIYNGLSTTLRPDLHDELAGATVESFSKTYPSGLYVSCSIFLPRPVAQSFSWQGFDRLVIRNGLTVAWEGIISSFGYTLGTGAEQGITISGIGAWGGVLGQHTIDKRWADDRLDNTVWRDEETFAGYDLCFVRRQGEIKFVPKAEAWTSGNETGATYTMPTGETIKRVTLDYDLQEAAQAWQLRLRDTVGATNIFSITASGTGSRNDPLGTPRQTLRLGFLADANQTPTSDGTYYGQVSNVVVYSETGNINLTEIATDVLGYVSNLNSDTSYIGSNTYSLVPFYTVGQEAVTRILERAAAYGDIFQNPWACMLIDSEKAASPDGKPVLKVEQAPALSDYDYAVRLDEPNVIAPARIERDFANIINWVSYRYRDETNDRYIVVTPDDDSNLTDSTSVTAYGERRLSQPLNLGNASNTVAANYAKRFLAENKDPKWIMSSPLQMKDTIRAKGGQEVPVSQVEPGKRIRIENFLQDLSGTTGAGLTFLITDTQHRDNGQVVSISAGASNNLAVMLAQLAYKRKGSMQNVSFADAATLF